MSIHSSRRTVCPPNYLLAALVCGLTLVCMNRTYAVTNAPNAVIVRYNLAASTELLVGIPVLNQGVHVMASCETLGARGVAFVDIARISGSQPFLIWTGQNAATGAGAGENTSGFFGIDEGEIAKVSFQGDVELESQNASTIAVSNESEGTRSGYVTLIY